VDFNKLIARVKAILLTPKTEWPVIAAEPTTVADLYKGYIVWLAAIPAIFTFLKLSLIGMSMPFAGTVRIGVGAGLTNMVVGYVLSLGVCYVMALIIEMLAPNFGAQKDRIQALKTVAYAYTASWIAGIGQILPGISILIMIAGGIYSIYLLYLALPHTMKCPPEKAGGYTAVIIVVAILLGLLVGAVVAGVTRGGMFMGGSPYSAVHDDSDVQFDKDSPIGKLEQWSKQVEKAGKEMEAAQRSGNQEEQNEAMQEMMGAALGGGSKVEALAPDRLKPFLPETLGGLARSTFSTERNSAMGMQMTEAKATYMSDAGRTLELEITDTGTAKGLLALAGWAGIEGENETDTGYDKTYHEDGRLVHEQWDKSSSRGEYSVVLGERFTVKVAGEADSIDDLKAALADIDLGALESMKGEGVANN
jgi:Yip1 domain